MMVHLKDKTLIRHKKRWSQVRFMKDPVKMDLQMFCSHFFTNNLCLQIMYLYYILGWKLNRQYFKECEAGKELDSLRERLKVSGLTLDFITRFF